MFLKALLVALAVAVLVIAGLGLQLKLSRDDNDRLTAEKQAAELALSYARGDLVVSAANADRMIADRDSLIQSMLDQEDAKRELATQTAHISTAIAAAPDGAACAGSAPVRAALAGIVELQQHAKAARGDLSPDRRVPSGQPAGGRVPVPQPRPAGNAGP